MVNNKKKTVEELAKEMDTACALSSEISEEELIEYPFYHNSYIFRFFSFVLHLDAHNYRLK